MLRRSWTVSLVLSWDAHELRVHICSPPQPLCSPQNCWTTLSEQVCMQYPLRRLISCSLLQMCFILLFLLLHSQPRSDPFMIISHSNGVTWQKYRSPAISGFAFFSSGYAFRVSAFWKPRRLFFFCQRKEWVRLLRDSTCRSFKSALSHCLQMAHIWLHGLTQPRTTRTPFAHESWRNIR